MSHDPRAWLRTPHIHHSQWCERPKRGTSLGSGTKDLGHTRKNRSRLGSILRLDGRGSGGSIFSGRFLVRKGEGNPRPYSTKIPTTEPCYQILLPRKNTPRARAPDPLRTLWYTRPRSHPPTRVPGAVSPDPQHRGPTPKPCPARQNTIGSGFSGEKRKLMENPDPRLQAIETHLETLQKTVNSLQAARAGTTRRAEAANQNAQNELDSARIRISELEKYVDELRKSYNQMYNDRYKSADKAQDSANRAAESIEIMADKIQLLETQIKAAFDTLDYDRNKHITQAEATVARAMATVNPIPDRLSAIESHVATLQKTMNTFMAARSQTTRRAETAERQVRDAVQPLEERIVAGETHIEALQKTINTMLAEGSHLNKSLASALSVVPPLKLVQGARDGQIVLKLEQ